MVNVDQIHRYGAFDCHLASNLATNDNQKHRFWLNLIHVLLFREFDCRRLSGVEMAYSKSDPLKDVDEVFLPLQSSNFVDFRTFVSLIFNTLDSWTHLVLKDNCNFKSKWAFNIQRDKTRYHCLGAIPERSKANLWGDYDFLTGGKMVILWRLRYFLIKYFNERNWERSDSVVECLTQDRWATGSNLTDVNELCPWARHIKPNLVLVKPRKIHSYITERLMVRKKSN